ncbi:GPP34 family phosphoprotein [Streptomyces sp. NPDC056835]|uniref:GOLPH3/VPS74 family protein n=1 Tax=Streptomyces sp. NPDC056835 TaxID=3345956 RepID=UPI0036C448BF
MDTSMRTTLGEQLMLLSLDDDTGAAKESEHVGWAIAGASLVELALAGRIEVADDKVTVLDPAQLGDPTLDAALADIAGQQKPGRTKDWIKRLKKDGVDGARQGLLRKGLIREETKKVLGLFPVRRYPESDGSVEEALRQRLDAVVMGGAEPDERTATLVALLHGAKLDRLAFPEGDKATVKANMEAIAHGGWVGPAVRQAVKAAEDAVTVMVTMTVVMTPGGS